MRRLPSGLLALVLLACGDMGPSGVSDAELHVVRQDPLAPPLLAKQASFWAKLGDGREVRMYYQGATPADTGEEYLRFEVPDNGLLRKPDGSLFQLGDSVLITITVVDTTEFLYRFEPSGLQFNPEQPARMKIRYVHGDHDFNADGRLDSTDATIETMLDLWRRTSPGAPWFKIGAVKFEELDELDANIFSFSDHAIAW